MDIVDVNKTYYNKLYKRKNPVISLLYSLISFDQQSKSKVNFRVIKAYLKGNFKRDLVVLDYGFGHGSLLLKYRSNHKLYACDISEEAVYNFPRVAKLVGKNVFTATVDQFLTKYDQVRFDVISLSHIIEHVEDDLHLVKILSEKLSETGIMLINIPINEVWQDPKHVRKYDVGYMRSLSEKCNMEIVGLLETDKLTSFFLIEEKVNNAGKVKLYGIKFMRLIFAVLPLSFTSWFEKVFLKKHKNQQLITLVRRK
jgi:SAM-dependent methyltransferase